MSDLETRSGLPPELLVLRETLPRADWEAHPNFTAMTRFWLDRHLMFRTVLQKLRDGSHAYLDGKAELVRHARETQHYAGFLLNQLHVHHNIEDHHYFPQLQTLDKRLEHGFELLDSDHDALGAHIDGLADKTNQFLRRLDQADVRESVGSLDNALGEFEKFLDRHLCDEEDLIVPVILTYAPEIG
ncbi:MAG: hemerythrin domain-containing protein [Rhodobacteraceae bacterium]|nr:hemerythrin domain-containing protein [Paracoccaceae bacterium]